MKKREKKRIAPNEASLVRWIITLAVSFPIGMLLLVPIAPFFGERVVVTPNLTVISEYSFMGISFAEFLVDLVFMALFCGLVIAIRLIGKTSLKDFVLGVGGKVNKKECLTITLLYVLGVVLNYLPDLGSIRLRHVNAGEFLFLVVFMVLTTWTQTTWEELIFRGFLARWICGNKLTFTKKSVIAAIVTSAAFAVAHSTNAEVTSQGGFRAVMAVTSYAIPGLVFFLANLHFGNLLPGIIMHAINNTLLFTVISEEVTTMPLPTLLVNTAPHTGEVMLALNILLYLPVVVYMILDARKKKKAPGMHPEAMA
ncbi:MAG: CPBP family intramembrane glutamic endopeptidase [Oscillospiraceae bacterium]